ncbi:ABC transporter substrate-binding protein [Salipiger sp.]|uniref:ABC transporter substrate-binding protein n=1 Tax=Salipiger sp. TaxID=2078585 RepID=UPI003A96C170
MTKFTRRAFAAMTTGAAALALSLGAVSAQNSDVGAAIEWAKTNLPASTPEIIRAAAEEGNLTLTLQRFGDDITTQAMIAKFNEHYPFIKVDYTMQNGSQIVKKFSAEQASGKGITDYLQFPSDQIQLGKFIDDGAFGEFVISDDSVFPDTAKQSGTWYPWLRQSNVTVYRVGALSDEEIELVKSYKGLTDPRFKGRIGMISGSTSNGRTGSYLLQYGDDPSLWDGLVANTPIVRPSSGPLLDGLMSGEFDVALMSGFPTAALAAKQGAPLEFLITSPSPVLFAPGLISSIAPHPNAAKLWADWGMSQEGQALWVELVGVPSARDDVPKPWVYDQSWFFDDRSVNAPLDWKDYSEKEQKVLETFQSQMQDG